MCSQEKLVGAGTAHLNPTPLTFFNVLSSLSHRAVRVDVCLVRVRVFAPAVMHVPDLGTDPNRQAS